MTDLARTRCALEAMCHEVGLDAHDARLLHRHSNTVYLLAHASVIVRISGSNHPGLCPRASLTITKWLAEQGVPVTVPFIDHAVEIDGLTATFWHYYPQHGRDVPPARELGAILRTLHSLPPPPFDLPDYVPLQHLTGIIDDPRFNRGLPEDSLSWLREQVQRQVTAYHQLRSKLGHGLVHGDAYRGNTLWGPDGVLLGDWDEISIAPRELDLINEFQSTRFGTTEAELTDFSAAYGFDVRTWDGYCSLRRMRDLHTLASYIRRAGHGDDRAAQELHHRIRSLLDSIDDARWHIVR
ncbi:phosphotransferase [Nocardia niigatensis]